MPSTVKIISTLFIVTLLVTSCRAASRPGPTEAPTAAGPTAANPTNVATSDVNFEGHTFDPMIDRLDPALFAASSSHKAVDGHDSDEEDLCVGLGENDCLTRRNLAAHHVE
ncbi:unnamed protein product [Linum tenue]|uniref:Phytosulfokine-beta n=1 Tax=Linum tenue TaxID=586396 RepID=A0AAV0J9E6_9ROSI|nr:unnamed protein product [Linum tenue]